MKLSFLLWLVGIVRNAVKLDTNVLFSTGTVLSDVVIEPAVYVSDLYGVLGLNRSSPVKDLKQAYLSIAFSNHPDRNSSLDALYLYQNASRAYSVLVRDPEKKRQYDSHIQAMEIVHAIEGLGAEMSSIATPVVTKVFSLVGGMFDQMLSTHPLEAQDTVESYSKSMVDIRGERIIEKDNKRETSDTLSQHKMTAPRHTPVTPIGSDNIDSLTISDLGKEILVLENALRDRKKRLLMLALRELRVNNSSSSGGAYLGRLK